MPRLFSNVTNSAKSLAVFIFIFFAFLPLLSNAASDEPVEAIETYVRKNPNKLKVKVFCDGVFIKEAYPDSKGEFHVTSAEIGTKVVRFRAGSELSESIKFSFDVIAPPDFPYVPETNRLDVVFPARKGTKITEKTKFTFKLLFKPIKAGTNKGAFIINPKMDSG